jgi:hypothetical protein
MVSGSTVLRKDLDTSQAVSLMEDIFREQVVLRLRDTLYPNVWSSVALPSSMRPPSPEPDLTRKYFTYFYPSNLIIIFNSICTCHNWATGATTCDSRL